jgi:Domain of unknown function (DUF4192)
MLLDVSVPSPSGSVADPTTVVKLHDASDVVAMVPYVVGYWPVESVVVVALRGARKRLGPTIRVDIVGSAQVEEVSSEVAAVLAGHRVTNVFVIGFSTEARRAEPAVVAMKRAVRRRHIHVEHALWADGRRWRCCHESPRCTPPEGTSYDADSMRVSAEAVAAGLTVGADRDDSRRLFERDSSSQAVEAAIRRRQRDQQAAPRPPSAVVQQWSEQPRPLDPELIATMAIGVSNLEIRDLVWRGMLRSTARAQLELWAEVTRAVPDDLLPAPCSLAGFAAWLAGDGTVARHAVERVQGVNPEYSMANLLGQILDRFLDPHLWDDFTTAVPATGLGSAGRR